MDERDFGAKIKARREELGLSQQDLAVALDLDQGKISLIEKGMRRIDTLHELPKLAKILQCQIDSFFEDLDEDTRSDSPVEELIKRYFPKVEFSKFEMKRIEQFMEPVLKQYVITDPGMRAKVDGLEQSTKKRRTQDAA